MAEVSSELFQSNLDNADDFVVYMCYKSHPDQTDETKIYSLKRSEIRIDEVFTLHGTVGDWLENLGVIEPLWDAAIDETLIGLEELVEKVESFFNGDSSWALRVHIVVHDNPEKASNGNSVTQEDDQRENNESMNDESDNVDEEEEEPEFYGEWDEPMQFNNNEDGYNLEEPEEMEIEEAREEEEEEEVVKWANQWTKYSLMDFGVKFNKASDVKDLSSSYSSSCVVCLEEFEDSSEESVGVLSCSHVFHEACLVPLIRKRKRSFPSRNPACPLCRKDVIHSDFLLP